LDYCGNAFKNSQFDLPEDYERAVMLPD